MEKNTTRAVTQRINENKREKSGRYSIESSDDESGMACREGFDVLGNLILHSAAMHDEMVSFQPHLFRLIEKNESKRLKGCFAFLLHMKNRSRTYRTQRD